MTTLVFLEHHDGALQKGSLGVLAQGSVARRRGRRRRARFRACATPQRRPDATGADTVYVWDDPALEAPLPQPRVDALEALVRQTGAETCSSRASVLSADIAAGLAARLDAGLNWDLTDVELRATASSSARGRRWATRLSPRSAGRGRRGWRSSARARSTRSRPAAKRRSRSSAPRSRTSRRARG